MEMIKTTGFVDLSETEMIAVDGGSDFFKDAWNEVCKGVTSFAVGAVVGAKVGAATCTPAGVVVGVVAGGIVNVAWDYLLK